MTFKVAKDSMLKVLYAEDDEFIRSAIAEKLTKRLPVVVTQSHSGNHAIKILQSGQRFDIVISDYAMPDGDGADLLRYIYASKLMTLFVLFTGTVCPLLPVTNDLFLGVIEKMDVDALIEKITFAILDANNIFEKVDKK